MTTRRSLPALLAAAVFCLAAGAASADVVYLKKGQRFEGAAEEKDGVVVLKLERGSLTFAKDQIERVEKCPPPWEVYDDKARGLAPGDAAGHLELAKWCKDHSLPLRMKQELERAAAADPDNEEARELLGHKKVDGRWLSPEEQLAAAEAAAKAEKEAKAAPAKAAKPEAGGKPEAEGPAPTPDGTYQGWSRGYVGDVQVEVTVALGKISEVKVVEQQETLKKAQVAIKKIPLQIVERQSVKVDGVSGATATSEAIKRAAASALASAKPLEIGAIPDGFYSGRSRGYKGDLTVQLSVKGGRIADAGVTMHHEDRPETALKEIPAAIVAAQNTQVDAVTGATATSTAIMRAAQNALESHRQESWAKAPGK